MSLEDDVRTLLDRQRIADNIYRYASATDDKDWDRLRSLFADDVIASYAGHPDIEGADALVKFIAAATAHVTWGHHMMSVAHIDIDGDVASTLTYHTSHSVCDGDPDTVIVKVARYRDVQRRQADGSWRFTRKVMEPGWNETRHARQRHP